MKTGFLLLAVALLTGSCNTRVPAKHDNLAEFHGACPKCSAVAVGHLVFWDGTDQNGNFVSGADYRAKCPSCGAQLFAPGDAAMDIDKREVKWTEVKTERVPNQAIPIPLRSIEKPHRGRSPAMKTTAQAGANVDPEAGRM